MRTLRGRGGSRPVLAFRGSERGSGLVRRLVNGPLAGVAALGLVSGALAVVSLSASAAPATLPTSTPLAFEDSNGAMLCDQGVSSCTGTTPDYLDWGSSYVQNHGLVSEPAVVAPCSPNLWIFTQGTKENTLPTTVTCGTAPPNKEDLTHEYAWDQTTQGDTFLYLAWEVAAVAGKADNHIDFELDQAAQPPLPAPGNTWTLDRTAGDLLINFDITNGNISISLFIWNSTSDTWVADTTLTSADWQASVNSSSFTDPYTSVSQLSGTFGEMGIDLTAADLFPAGVCKNFADVWAKTRSSGSGGTAELKDFIPPTGISVANCSSSTSTTPSSTDIALGKSLTDSATVTGIGGTPVPTGTVTFYWCGPRTDAATVTSGSDSVADTAITATDQGRPVSGTGIPLGTYVGTVTPGTSFLLSSSPSSQVNVNATAAGTSVSLGADSCSASAGTQFDQENLSGGTVVGTSVQVTSTLFQPSQPGDYCFAGVYSGDSNYPGSSDGSSDECFRVDAVSTDLSATSTTAGGSVSDSASLAGVVAPLTNDGTPGGTADTVTYTVYTDATCDTQASVGVGNDISAQPGTVSVNTTTGAVPPSPSVTFNQKGTYYWQAVFSGDKNNAGAKSPCTSEELTVGINHPTISTSLSTTDIAVGNTAFDTSALGVGTFSTPLTNDGTSTGTPDTVTYTVYTTSNCAPGTEATAGVGKDINAQPATVNVNPTTGAIPDSADVTFNLPGIYYWQASFSGDVNNAAATSPCTLGPPVNEEELFVDAVSTLLSGGPITVGGSVHDTASLAGVTSNAGGTVTYTVYTNGTCTTTATTGTGGDINSQPGAVPVTNGTVPPSPSVTFNQVGPGTYYWQAEYSGDGSNADTKSPCTSEALVVNPASPTISTTPSGPATLPGVSLSDSAQLSDFQPPLTNDGTSTGTPDTVTFTLYGPSAAASCTRTDLVNTQTVNIDITAGTASTATAVPISTAGNYWWVVTYNGDPNNKTVTSGCGVEESVVNPAAPTITTTPSGPVTLPGVSVSDSAQLSGFQADLTSDGTASGTPDTVTFNLYGPSPTANCSTAAVSTQTVNIDITTGAASASAVPVTTAGHYWWTATFNGDPNNNTATSGCGLEESVVNAAAVPPPPLASPTITTSASPSFGTTGVAMTDVGDTATFHNTSSGGATGSVTFTLYSDSNCKVAVSGMSGSGTISTSGGVSKASWSAASWTPPAAGVYYWIASYLGDGNNHGFTTGCGDAGEEITVATPATSPASPFLEGSKSSVPASGSTVVPGETVSYGLTLTNLGKAVASAITETDTVPAGTTYVPGSASCGGVPTCSVTVVNGVVTWTGISVAALTGGTAGTVLLSFQVTINSNVTNGQVIPNFALFTNENTPSCTTSTCPTNTVTLTVKITPVTAPNSSPPPIVGATTVHTGEPWAGSRLLEGMLGLFGVALFGLGRRRRRQYRVRTRGTAA